MAIARKLGRPGAGSRGLRTTGKFGESRTRSPPWLILLTRLFGKKDTLYLPSSLLYSMKMWKLGCIAVALFSGLLANAQIPTPDQAVALEQQGKLAEAEKNWRQITQADPRDAAAFASLGLVLSKQGKYGQ